MLKRTLFIAAAASLASTPASAHPVKPSHFTETSKPYASYEFLIGDWYSRPAGEDMTLHQQFKWGPQKSYITYATYMVPTGQAEQLHFEGMMVWNGSSKALDFLFAVAPGSGVEEKGTVSAAGDGTVVRDVEMTDQAGKTERFRQTFRRGENGTVVTSIRHQTAKGWETSPPGDLVIPPTSRRFSLIRPATSILERSQAADR